mmetsp:Transcript_10518/g.34748  ORF Transcript_10518/g.34748 Transcript_10518/m.34748 type:complete len:144 (+) Transcript_10518:1187-1618(+)
MVRTRHKILYGVDSADSTVMPRLTTSCLRTFDDLYPVHKSTPAAPYESSFLDGLRRLSRRLFAFVPADAIMGGAGPYSTATKSRPQAPTFGPPPPRPRRTYILLPRDDRRHLSHPPSSVLPSPAHRGMSAPMSFPHVRTDTTT